jgi:hypothetical protein
MIPIIYKEGAILLVTIIMSISVYEYPDKNLTNFFTTFVKCSNALPQELLNWLAIIITLAAMLVASRKDYYLAFSVPDVLEQYKFKKRTLTVINMMIVVKLFDIAKDICFNQIYNSSFRMVIIVSYIRAILLCVYLIYKVIDILYSQEKIELKLLDKLYLKVRTKLLISSACYNENVAGTVISCDYLCSKHMNEYKNIDKRNIRDQKGSLQRIVSILCNFHFFVFINFSWEYSESNS